MTQPLRLAVMAAALAGSLAFVAYVPLTGMADSLLSTAVAQVFARLPSSVIGLCGHGPGIPGGAAAAYGITSLVLAQTLASPLARSPLLLALP